MSDIDFKLSIGCHPVSSEQENPALYSTASIRAVVKKEAVINCSILD